MNDFEGLEKLLEESPLNSGQKALFKGYFKALGQVQKETFSQIKNNIEDKIAAKLGVKQWQNDIVTVLGAVKNKDSFKEAGLWPIVDNITYNSEVICDSVDKLDFIRALGKETSNIAGGVAFLNTAYSDLEAFVDDRLYSARVTLDDTNELRVTYRLHPYYGFIEKERVLYLAAFQNRIEGPVINSPWSRKAVRVVLNPDSQQLQAIEAAEKVKIDFAYADNGLEKVLINDKLLLWNLKLEDSKTLARPALVVDREDIDNIEHRIVPYKDDQWDIYSFNDLKKNEYIVVKEWDREVYRDEDRIFITIDKYNDIKAVEYQKLVINSINFNQNSISREAVFSTALGSGILCRPRLHSKADFLGAIETVKPAGLELAAAGIAAKKNPEANSVRIYANAYAYKYKAGWVKQTGKYPIYISFIKTEDAFFEDRVSYLLSYLNYRYPEYIWVGDY